MILSQKNKSILVVVISIGLYFLFAYNLDRTNFTQLISLYLGLFIPFLYFIKKEHVNFPFLVGIAILFRLVFLFAVPNLSQDFYRFIWDGRMLLEGFNPYISLPETFINERNFPIPQAIDLYNGMGPLNGSHYTNYPPINQLNFFLAALFSGKSILGAAVVLRLQIILADIGIIYFGKKILEKLQLPIHHIFLYALNPFIIIELTGNLHFEAVMLFFLVWSIYLLLIGRWVWAAIILGLSVSVKLIPLLFLPLFLQWFTSKSYNNHTERPLDSSRGDNMLSGKAESRTLLLQGVFKFVSFAAIVIALNIVLFLPFVSPDLISSYSNSVGLWFRNFEFNASIYFIAREIGYLFRGWNEIAIIGKIMPILTITFLTIITFFRKNKTPQQLITALLFGLSFYYFTTTTMHPWYLATLLLLSVFTKYRFPLVWSVVMILSYQAYANEPWKENLWFVGLEYVIVYGFLIVELLKKRRSMASKV
ncbi:mannosyltransferase [Flavobacteriaceae bacterium S356]|uniref:Mannosyltransferase n=1 Tax=Asprobacillus argus TaxID=3076534 RepID=A0ABU3LAR0_9FLAO|nr:mannosyltransferase [Flavobacteriaceae bacterium S356]